jgi:dTMP kinase
MKPTFYLTIEGTDGSGKTTLVKGLLQYFESKGLSVLLTKEFGSTHDKFCEQARSLALSSEFKLEEVAGQLVWLPIIRQHHEKVIKPSLGHYDIILSDRGKYSNYCYGPEHQKSEADKKMILSMFDLLYADCYPADINIFLDLPLDLATKRRLAREPEKFANNAVDRVEAKGQAFQEKVKENFLKMSQSNTDLVSIKIKESMTPDDVLKEAILIIENLPFYSFKS